MAPGGQGALVAFSGVSENDACRRRSEPALTQHERGDLRAGPENGRTQRPRGHTALWANQPSPPDIIIIGIRMGLGWSSGAASGFT
jgi:hypothetical protein